jgi:hypothetical protein
MIKGNSDQVKKNPFKSKKNFQMRIKEQGRRDTQKGRTCLKEQ